MNQIDHSIDDVIAAYQAKVLTREQVAQWLAQRKVAAPGKPCTIELCDPAVGLGAHTLPPDKPTLALSPLPAPAQSTPEREQSWEIDVIDHGGGVYALELRGQALTWNAALTEQLREAMQLVAARADAHALLLRGGAQFLPEDGEQAFFDSSAALLPLDCPLPVIAVLEGDACGPAWLFAALCDFVLCAEESSYRYVTKISAAEQALLDARYRLGDAGAVLLSDIAHSGRQLETAGLGLTVLPRSDVNTAAQALAGQLAAAPAPALVLLKQHMAQELRALAQAMLDVWRSAGQRARTIARLPAGLPGGHPAPGWPLSLSPAEANPGAPPRQDVRQIDTGSTVVRLDIDAGGVALLTLCDQRGSNAFSDELVGGVARAFDAVAGLPQARVLVLSAEGSYFSTGGTRASLLAIQAGHARFTDIDIYSRPATLGIPVIAAMQGHGVGAGWAFGMFCDILVHSTQHSYSSPYMRYGFTPGAGATLAFAEKFGLDLAREILFCAGQYSGAALRTRGVPGVFAAGGAVTACALALAAQLAVHDRAALEVLKRQNGARIAERRQAAFAQEQAMHAQCFVGNADVLSRIGQHFDEGMAAVTEAGEVLPAAPQRGEQAPADTLLQELRAMLAEELFMQAADIDAQQKFIDIGLDSITGVNWVRKINTRYALALNATAIYRHPTLHDFMQYVREQAPTTAAPAPVAVDSIPAQKICTITAPVTASKPVPAAEQKIELPAQQPAGTTAEKIAVIGMAGQFPKARDLAQFWRNLAEGRDCISEIPPERWSIERYVDSDPKQPGKSYSKWLGCLDDVALFDPLFFGISPREAEWMDPQQRVFLQNAWHCVEDAGYSPAALSGSRCGVFVGCTAGDYSQQIERLDLNAQNFMGRATSILAAKIAYLLNLQGPCLSIDTACSSSLVAMAAACDSLVSGASDMALAGGVCVLAGPDMHIMTSKAGMLSADGRCRTFDERANGFVPGEGVAVLMLKRLEDAERDGDAIHGVISGWGVNQDGKTNGMTAPNPQAQARLAQQVYRQFAIAPDTIDLVEAHGTGTRLGDPIEVEGLKEAFGAFGTRSGYCALGSVKSNIGHTLAAAGIAGAVKLLLALRHQLMPATLHVEQVNTHIALNGSPFFINSSARPWLPMAGKTRRAAVSSFGFSGTNAHMVIEEYIPLSLAPALAAGGPHAIVLSARQPDRLPFMARRLLDFLEQPEQQAIALADVAYTLQVGREAMAARLALEVHTLDELRSALRELARGGEHADHLSPPVAAWVAGAPLDWMSLYWQGTAQPRRLSLPGYPFELQRYWLPATAAAPVTGEAPAMLHPLLHQQTSTLFSGQRYSSRFSGAEFFFAQHQIMGRPVLPGVGHLEMVRAAVHAACAGQLDTRRMQIKNVVWMRPVACEAKTITLIHIALTRHEDGEIGFTIFSDAADTARPPIVHSQGVVLAGALDDTPTIDLAAVRA
ncbi:MAG: beta-ketoacyl synthase N-terminal-like domain-containing protein, partial [Duganella sp.]